MSIISKCGRGSLKMRLFIAGLYAVLILGAVTMVYPFMLMLATSITSGADVNKFQVVPQYLYDNNALFPKYADDRYASDVEMINQYYGTEFAKCDDVVPPNIDPKSQNVRVRVAEWNGFVKSLPISYKQAAFEPYINSPSRLLNAYRAYCRNRFGGDITKLNKAYIEENDSFNTLTTPFERFKLREWEPEKAAKMQEWLLFKSKLPAYFLRPILMDPAYGAFLRDTIYEGSIDKLNAAWGAKLKSFEGVKLSPKAPTHPAQRADWEKFVRENLPFRYMRVDPSAASSFRQYLSERYKGNISELNKFHGTRYGTFANVNLPKKMPTAGSPLVDWMDFIATRVSLDHITAINTENLYRERLLCKYGSLVAANAALGTSFKSTLDIRPPAYEADYLHVLDNTAPIRREFMGRNYAFVADYFLLHGRAVFNTVVFVMALILVHLIVNPMCAYALSRYNLPYAYKVLLFLLATMAFPAEVAMIPSFLLLKNFHLLNTFWALILPGMANGYAIFLLKGFFDSLPKELYEAGIIDGASEGTMFRKITIPMSKPIFAVIALQSFTHAYTAFMYAMLVCQDPKMWTMMVWLYQLQIAVPQYVTMAALVITAIPTLLVFIFAQNVIMRGIIIPTFK